MEIGFGDVPDLSYRVNRKLRRAGIKGSARYQYEKDGPVLYVEVPLGTDHKLIERLVTKAEHEYEHFNIED